MQDNLWDGIKRDRLVWMGDMHPEVMSLMAVFGPQEVLTASLDYMRATTPAEKWMNGMPSYTLWWIRCQHDWYRYTGDLAYLKTHHAYLKAVAANLAKGWLLDPRVRVPDTGVRRDLPVPAAVSTVDGVRRVCSAVCTHLGGIVRWDDTENSWDCPLHGSRFGPDGEVLTGPAVDPLRRLDNGVSSPSEQPG